MSERFDDADLEHEWAKRYRIPLVTSFTTRWRYEVALMVKTPGAGVWDDVWKVVWPTELEAKIIGVAIDFRRSYYNTHWQSKMLEQPLDIDSGTNTLVLCKMEDGWLYRSASWSNQIWSHESYPDLPTLLAHRWGNHSGWPALRERINELLRTDPIPG